MATNVITGRDITLTIASTNYDAQTTSAVLSNSPTIDVYQTLDGKAYKHTDDQWTFNVELLSDWGATSSLFEAMWAAAESAPDTTISVTLTAATGAQFVFPILPEFPTAGGSGIDAQTVSFTFKIANGTVTETFS